MRRCREEAQRQLYQRKNPSTSRERRFWENGKFENDNGSKPEDTNRQAVCRKLDRYEEA